MQGHLSLPNHNPLENVAEFKISDKTSQIRKVWILSTTSYTSLNCLTINFDSGSGTVRRTCEYQGCHCLLPYTRRCQCTAEEHPGTDTTGGLYRSCACNSNSNVRRKECWVSCCDHYSRKCIYHHVIVMQAGRVLFMEVYAVAISTHL